MYGTEEFNEDERGKLLHSRRFSKPALYATLLLLLLFAAALVPIGFKLLTHGMLETMAVYSPHHKKEMDRELNSLGREESPEKREARRQVLISKLQKAIEKEMTDDEAKLETSKTEEAASIESANSLNTPPTAQSIQKQAEDEFINAGGSEGSETFRTIYNVSYNKESLANCKQFCLLRIRDPNGLSISAVINGPEYAAILGEHSGTINLTGKKRLIKNHNVFMVQNITFNLVPIQVKPLVDANNGKLRYTKRKIKEKVQNRGFGYEDLRIDYSH